MLRKSTNRQMHECMARSTTVIAAIPIGCAMHLAVSHLFSLPAVQFEVTLIDWLIAHSWPCHPKLQLPESLDLASSSINSGPDVTNKQMGVGQRNNLLPLAIESPCHSISFHIVIHSECGPAGFTLEA